MRKIISVALAALLGTGLAMAEGYQVNTLSAKQLGMGHTLSAARACSSIPPAWDSSTRL